MLWVHLCFPELPWSASLASLQAGWLASLQTGWNGALDMAIFGYLVGLPFPSGSKPGASKCWLETCGTPIGVPSAPDAAKWTLWSWVSTARNGHSGHSTGWPLHTWAFGCSLGLSLGLGFGFSFCLGLGFPFGSCFANGSSFGFAQLGMGQSFIVCQVHWLVIIGRLLAMINGHVGYSMEIECQCSKEAIYGYSYNCIGRVSWCTGAS